MKRIAISLTATNVVATGSMSNIITIDTSLNKWDTAVLFSMSTTARTIATITSIDLITTNLNLRSLLITMLSFDLRDIYKTARNTVY